ncbi:MAG: UDP-N-acetylmuramoyl-L-alanine--D-glutamate ligase [Candidatus Paceibacterota bacterium]
MPDYKEFFKNKKVTVVGLGLLGKRLGDIAFLAECGAKVLVTDLKTAEELAPSIQKLKKYKNITYVLGEHRYEDFDSCDFVLKGQGVALDSPYIKYAEGKGIPIEMDESLFAKLAPKVQIVGVTGTRGKTTTTILIYEILKASGMRVYLGGNIKGTAALPLLKEVKDWDVVVFELSSWQLQGFGEAKISPHISVFTNFMPDHMNYYKNDMESYFKDKSYIYKFQNENDMLVLGPSMPARLNSRSGGKKVKGPGKTITAKNVPKSWKVKLAGEHNLENIACAVEVARILKIKENVIKKVVEKFEAISGRLELVRNIRGVAIYNDTNSTTPDATLAALNSFHQKVILIMGGMNKELSAKKLDGVLPKKTKKVILIPGSGAEQVKNQKINLVKIKDLKEALSEAMKTAEKGDVVLFSPAFASFNMFKNEYDRGEQFMKIVKKLK